MTKPNHPLTPDFIEHPWHPLACATLKNNFVELHWSDNLEFHAYALWLWENAESTGIEPTVREGIVEPSDLPAADALLGAAVDSDGALVLNWLDNQAVRIHPGWLRYVAEGQLSVANTIPTQKVWTSTELTEPPTLEGADILARERVQQAWLENLIRFGLCRLVNTPLDEQFLNTLMTTVGPIRASNFGNLFQVRSSPTPDSTANTGLNLGQHTDLPTRETPPGYQFLHCIENTASGGHSRMTDGLAVVRALETEQPAAFELLTTERWVFMNRTPGAEHRWEGSIIELPDRGRPLTLRAFYPVRSAPRMAEEKIPAAYDALKIFSRYSHDPRFQISYAFQAGDLVGFDNRRVMHGRDAFDTSGTRFLAGCYVDHDEIYSRLRVLNRPTTTKAKSDQP